jgi:hypothetical protein
MTGWTFLMAALETIHYSAAARTTRSMAQMETTFFPATMAMILWLVGPVGTRSWAVAATIGFSSNPMGQVTIAAMQAMIIFCFQGNAATLDGGAGTDTLDLSQ